VYAHRYPALLSFGVSTGQWVDTVVPGNAYQFATLKLGTFAVGFNGLNGLVAYRHPGNGGAWAAARGIPADTRVGPGSIIFVVVPIEPDRALLVWEDAAGIRATFIE
jgi:hypothetical protein